MTTTEVRNRAAFTVAAGPGWVYLGLSGEFDVTTTAMLDRAFDNLRPQDARCTVILDLARTVFFDASSVAVLMRHHYHLRGQGVAIRPFGARGAVSRVFAVLGVAAALDCDRDG